jgi:hypothetical protein
MWWRSLREVMPLSRFWLRAARLSRVIRSTGNCGPGPPLSYSTTRRPNRWRRRRDEVSKQIAGALGGHVETIAPGPSGRAAVLWSETSYPPWYRLVIWPSGHHAIVGADMG